MRDRSLRSLRALFPSTGENLIPGEMEGRRQGGQYTEKWTFWEGARMCSTFPILLHEMA